MEDIDCLEFWLAPGNADRLAALRQGYPELADLVDIIGDRVGKAVATRMTERKIAIEEMEAERKTAVMTIKSGDLNARVEERD